MKCTFIVMKMIHIASTNLTREPGDPTGKMTAGTIDANSSPSCDRMRR